MCHPPGKRGTELGAQIFADVKVSDARPSTEPLQDSAHGKINAESTHVDGNRSRGLKNIKYHVRANAMRAFHNRMRVHNVGAAEEIGRASCRERVGGGGGGRACDGREAGG